MVNSFAFSEKSMFRKQFALTLLLAAVFSSGGCRKTNSVEEVPSTPVSTTSPYSTSFFGTGWSYRLRPLKSEKPKNTDEVKQVWRDLFTRMANDAKTLELLKRLSGDLPVEFIVLDAEQAKDKERLKAPPSDGKAVVIRVADTGKPDEKVAGDEFPLRVLAVGRAVLLKDAENPSSLEGLTENMKREPSGGAALTLAMKEYLLRHAVGYGMLSGPAADDEDLPKSIEDQRQVLDKQIKEHAEHAKEFYESRRRK
jgi:hypothetical protein